MRVAFDTNVLVSAVATRGLCADVFNLVLAEHQLIVGETVLAEIRRVLKRKLRVPEEIIGEFEALLRAEALVVPKATVLAIVVRDKSDMPVLAEAISGKAEVLVTGDRDLLEIVGAVPLDVLTPRGLWERLRAPSR
ncbi:MAG: putative toxin-antitoxin system toxin component, PIN family [Pseudomonadota bacterium]